jgi:hypothetical protein
MVTKMQDNQTNTGGGVKFDQEKLRVDLLPWVSIIAVARVLSYGSKKYGCRNWEKGISFSRLVGAMLRHLLLWLCGQEFDKETKLPHVFHMATNAMMLVYMYSVKPEFNDIPKFDENTQKIVEQFIEQYFEGK